MNNAGMRNTIDKSILLNWRFGDVYVRGCQAQHLYQAVLIAVTGSIRAAKAAGMIPDTIPITDDTDKPRAIFLNDNTKSIEPIGKNESIKTKNNPPKPPSTERKIDSNKNWNRIK